MMKKITDRLKVFFASSPRTGRGGKLLATVFIAMFLLGYGTTGSIVPSCRAADEVEQLTGPQVITSTCTSPCEDYGVPIPCTIVGSTAIDAAAAIAWFKGLLEGAAVELETLLDLLVHGMVQAILEKINQLELDIIAWWKTMWYYNLLPSLQAMTRQLNVAITDEVTALQAATDASNQSDVNHGFRKHEVEEQRTFRTSENGCVVATAAGGYGRATRLGNAMRGAWERESQMPGLNSKKMPDGGVATAAEMEARRYADYKKFFCDPDGNGGRNACPGTAKPEFYSADTQPTKFIYNQLTIDVTKPEMAKAVETINNNMVGVTSADTISPGAIASAEGQKTFLDRRAYLARYAALRSVPNMISGWRMPGSGPKMGEWVTALRKDAGINTTSENPSYKEILHAASIDRFNSGKYANGLISPVTGVEMEILSINAFYLMQLRDYYELLERTALTLAVQVSLMAEQVPMPDAVPVSPLKGP